MPQLSETFGDRFVSHPPMRRLSYSFQQMRVATLCTLFVGGAVACSVAGKEWEPTGEPAPEAPTPQPVTTLPSPITPADTGATPVEPGPSLSTKVLYLQPLGQELAPESVDLVETALREFYGFQIKRAEVRPLPPFAYYPPRKRYRAEKLLNYLGRIAPPDAFFVLGLTGVDISTTKGRIADWGIMGLATIDGHVAVMSMFRCRRGSRSVDHAQERLAKVAVHEVGHNLGLEHCPTRGCLMEDARGTNTTTDREYTLCPRCRRLLAEQDLVLPPNPRPPWPRP